ncbi:hypothetical protein E3N88_10493 [Mikania micrantha]|uniref:DUF4219 domain-containing protein n=1 Tax=Mikania micrantha TaxID=192012 RepID=A0A5N6PCI0_9ASTR|nr:hypothetical protein E3N88_10493 [Mikania micrantha]
MTSYSSEATLLPKDNSLLPKRLYKTTASEDQHLEDLKLQSFRYLKLLKNKSFRRHSSASSLTKTSEINSLTKTVADYPLCGIKCKRLPVAFEDQNIKCLLYLAKNGTLNKPPMFTPEDYDTWKVRMDCFIRNQDFKLWKSVLVGPFVPTVPAAGAGGATVPKDPALYSDEDYKRMEVDSKALWLIQMAIPNSIIHAFKKCKSAQELWNSLLQMYEGSEDVKENKKDMLKQKFENFCQENNEKMSS